ncbi:hypothetical protein BSKO_07729 [Bryopsis sp. KO-2023]|nr:hypothetical protein BSKO_07729 [Bryopsis sp. KO-2023]
MRELLSQTSMASSASEEPPDAVERDPSRRYWRFDEVLGRGAFKTVYKAFDEREGIEVAWNKVSLGGAVQEGDNRDRLFAEINVLKRLKHKNIMTFYDSWLDEKSNTLNFITELFTDGSLRKFRFKHKHLELKVLKKWAWQILQGLVYLHGHEPPIIHRDLKCDNIFINGVSGVLKIGDLGLATLWKGLTAPQSVLGTPEFMAPEYYNEKYDEKVDVYAFGMLLLELASMDYPYCECTNPAAIFKKVSQGIHPASLQKIRTKELRNFIELCIAHEPKDRLATRKLLKHPFFNSVRNQMEPKRQRSTDDMTASVASSHSSEGDLQHSDPFGRVTHLTAEHIAKLQERRHPVDVSNTQELPESGVGEGGGAGLDGNGEEWQRGEDCDSDGKFSEGSGGGAHPNPPPISPFERQADNQGQTLSIQCTKLDGTNLIFTLRFEDHEGKKKAIQFPFNLNDDTADQIVAEMVEEHSHINLSITEEEADLIGQMIGKEVERSRNEGSEELTAYVSVQRTVGEPADSAVEPSSPVVNAGNGVMESIVGELMDDLATNHHSGEDDLVRALSARTGDILAVMNKGEGMLGSCMLGRGPPLMPVIHEDTWSAPANSGSNRGCSGTETTGREQPSGGAEERYSHCVHSEAIDIKSPARDANLVVSPLHTASSSPPCVSHARNYSEKGNDHRKQRSKSEPPEPDESSPKMSRKTLSGRPSSEGSIGFKASFRKQFSRFEEVDAATSVPEKMLEAFGGERQSPRSDAPFPTSVSLLLLQKKGPLGECQESGHNTRRMAEVTAPQAMERSRSPDGRMTAISMLTVKPPAVTASQSPSFGFQMLESRSTPTFVDGMDLGEQSDTPAGESLEQRALSHLSESLHSASPNVSPRGSDAGRGSPGLPSATGNGHGEPLYPLARGVSTSLPNESAFTQGPPPPAYSIPSSELDSSVQVGRRESSSSLTHFEANMLRSVPVSVADYHSENGVVPGVRPMLDARLFSEEVELDEIGDIRTRNPPVSIGMFDRAATPPLIPVGHPHLTCAASTTPPSVGSMARSWASVASGNATLAKHHSFESEKHHQHQHHQHHEDFPDSVTTQSRSRSPEEKSTSLLTEELNVKANGFRDISGVHGIRRRSVSTHEPMDLHDMVSQSKVLPFGGKSVSVGEGFHGIARGHSASLHPKMNGLDFGPPPMTVSSVSPPLVANGGGPLIFGDRSGSPSGVSLPDLSGNATWPSEGQTASSGRNSADGESRPPPNVVVSSQSSSPSGAASPLALSASGDNVDQKTVQKSVDKELALKVKEMEAQQLDNFCSGFSTRGRSITRSKPLRRPLNGSGPA